MVGMSMYHMHACALSPGTGLREVSYHMGAVNQAQVLWKSVSVLNSVPSLQPYDD